MIDRELERVRVVGCPAPFRLGKEMIIMETFLEFLREVLKGIVREIGAYFFWNNISQYRTFY